MIVVITPLVVGLVGTVAGQGVGRLGPRARFPGITPGAVQQASRVIQGLLRSGLRPRVTTGPLGDVVVGTEDQDLDTLAAEAAIRQLQHEVLTEVLAEDPLLFIRGLPVGDPRRVAVGLDPPGAVPTIPGQFSSPAQRAITTIARARTRGVTAPRPAFTTRALGRFAVR